jgi:hypothetical protein
VGVGRRLDTQAVNSAEEPRKMGEAKVILSTAPSAKAT